VLEEFRRIVAEGVTEAELGKARNIALADFWRGLATIDGKAQGLGNFDVFQGSYEKLFDLPARVEAVTADHLRAAAARVLRAENMTVGVLRGAGEQP